MDKKIVFLDIDGVLQTHGPLYKHNVACDTFDLCDRNGNIIEYEMKLIQDSQYKSVFWGFNTSLLRNIQTLCLETNSEIVLSSDWRFTSSELVDLKEIFKQMNCPITKETEHIMEFDPNKNIELRDIGAIEEIRALEITKFVFDYKIDKFVIIDDLDLSAWFPDNFVRTTDTIGFDNNKLCEALLILRD